MNVHKTLTSLGNGGAPNGLYRLAVGGFMVMLSITSFFLVRYIMQNDKDTAILRNIENDVATLRANQINLIETLRALTSDRYTASQANIDWVRQDRRDNEQDRRIDAMQR